MAPMKCITKRIDFCIHILGRGIQEYRQEGFVAGNENLVYSIGAKLLEAVKAFYRDSRARVTINDQIHSEEFITELEVDSNYGV